MTLSEQLILAAHQYVQEAREKDISDRPEWDDVAKAFIEGANLIIKQYRL